MKPCLLALAAAACLALPLLATAQVELPQAAAQPPSARPAPVKVAQAKTESRPTWHELTAAQKLALAPLANTWVTLSEAHKRKWIALSQNYPSTPPAEQARMHSRMAEWAALSPQQRNQARLNFAESQKVAPDDKKAKWEAYQALPPEEKKKLAAGAAQAKPAAPPTAVAAHPVPPQKLARTPKSKPEDGSKTPKIAGVPAQVDQNTLLPQPGQVPQTP